MESTRLKIQKRSDNNLMSKNNVSSEMPTPTNAELMDIESPHFSQDWWHECEILPPDPWAYIVSDFQWSLELLAYAEARIEKIKSPEVGHFPETTKPTKRLQYALTASHELREDLAGMISVKCADLEFAFKWGEYQKAIAIIHGAIPQLEKQKAIVQTSKGSALLKFQARQWYALWLEDYKSKTKNAVSREMFNPFFAKILTEIRDGKREIPDAHRTSVLALVDASLSQKPREDGRPRLTRNFTEDFWADNYELALETALKDKSLLPPYGEGAFKLK